jgi:hypothetical protein
VEFERLINEEIKLGVSKEPKNLADTIGHYRWKNKTGLKINS